jgi:hypothetical protein
MRVGCDLALWLTRRSSACHSPAAGDAADHLRITGVTPELDDPPRTSSATTTAARTRAAATARTRAVTRPRWPRGATCPPRRGGEEIAMTLSFPFSPGFGPGTRAATGSNGPAASAKDPAPGTWAMRAAHELDSNAGSRVAWRGPGRLGAGAPLGVVNARAGGARSGGSLGRLCTEATRTLNPLRLLIRIP